MKHFSALVMAVGLLLSSSTSRADVTLQGRWFDDHYLFVLNDTWQDVTGSWGASSYKLAWDPVYRTIEGSTAGQKQSVEFALDQRKILSAVPCGWMDYEYELGAQATLKGHSCATPVDRTFATESELLDWVKREVFAQLVMDFPEPTRAEVAEFFYRIAQF